MVALLGRHKQKCKVQSVFFESAVAVLHMRMHIHNTLPNLQLSHGDTCSSSGGFFFFSSSYC